MASSKMLQVNLKPYGPPQLSSSHRFPVPMAMNRPRNCSTHTSQLRCSSSNLSHFVVANTMANNEMLLVTAEQPIRGRLSVLTMSDDQIMNHIYAGHVHAENILQQSTHIVDNILLGTREYLEEKLSTANFSPLLCTFKQLFSKELSLLAQKINFAFNLRKMQIELCHQQREDVEAYWEEVPETPKDIVEAFKALIFTEDNLQPLIDGSTNKMVGIDVLKKVEQWTDDIRNMFEILRSKMPWYVVQCFSQVVGIKFSLEEWHFKNEPIVVVMNPRGEVEYPNAFGMIRLWGTGTSASGFTNPDKKEQIPAIPAMSRSGFGPVIGPKKKRYTFFYGGPDKEWINRFAQLANHVAQDSLIKKLNISIEVYRIGNDNKNEAKQRLLKVMHGSEEKVKNFLDFFKNDKRGWVVLSDEYGMLVADHGVKMLMVLERFDGHWKKKVEEIGFGRSFEFSHNNFR